MCKETCQNCGKNAETTMIEFRHDLIGRCCPDCKACRKGRPYAKRAEYLESLKPTAKAAKGETYAKSTR